MWLCEQHQQITSHAKIVAHRTNTLKNICVHKIINKQLRNKTRRQTDCQREKNYNSRKLMLHWSSVQVAAISETVSRSSQQSRCSTHRHAASSTLVATSEN